MQVNVSVNDREWYSKGTITLDQRTPPEVIVHELGHWLEMNEPAIMDAAKEFLRRRTAGETAQPLRKLTGLDYGPTELARPDKFRNPYIGRAYERNGKVFATEVISMGLQYLYEDAYGLSVGDPDYFEFLWTVLHSQSER